MLSTDANTYFTGSQTLTYISCVSESLGGLVKKHISKVLTPKFPNLVGLDRPTSEALPGGLGATL